MKKLASNSLELRNLVRHKMPRPTIYFKDKKRHNNKNKCREKKENEPT